MASESESTGIRRVISGGQTGVDRAALDAALKAGVPIGGWCPRGRRAEDGAVPAEYALEETPSDEYGQRTLWNVRDSDGTLIIARGEATGGTLLTREVAGQQGRPCLQISPTAAAVPHALAWLREHGIRILNVAGPRESEEPGIYAAARAILERLIELSAQRAKA